MEHRNFDFGLLLLLPLSSKQFKSRNEITSKNFFNLFKRKVKSFFFVGYLDVLIDWQIHKVAMRCAFFLRFFKVFLQILLSEAVFIQLQPRILDVLQISYWCIGANFFFFQQTISRNTWYVSTLHFDIMITSKFMQMSYNVHTNEF